MARSLLFMRHVEKNNDNLRRVRSRYWFGTIWEENDKRIIKDQETEYKIISDDDHTKETSTYPNRLHWHCLLKFKNPVQWPPSLTTHWEKPVNIIKARQYCLEKGPNYYEEGTLQIRCQNGEEWKGFVEQCKISTPKEMIDGPFSQLYARYRSFAGEVFNQFSTLTPNDGELNNLWLTGEPGTGKTRYVWNNFQDLYVKSLNKWWDGYHGQENVLLDDWDPNHKVLIWHLKIWADRYPFNAETKGSSMMIRPQKIIITSNYTIEECFENPEDVKAIRRRFKVIRFWTVGGMSHNSAEIE